MSGWANGPEAIPWVHCSTPPEDLAHATKVDTSEPVPFILGANTFCADGAGGEITRAVFDPVTRMVSHFVVEPKHRQGLGRTMPSSLIDSSTAGIPLNCTSAKSGTFAHPEEMQFLPGTGGGAPFLAGRPPLQLYESPGDVIGDVPQPINYDTIPDGEVEFRCEEYVDAFDGAVIVESDPCPWPYDSLIDPDRGRS